MLLYDLLLREVPLPAGCEAEARALLRYILSLKELPSDWTMVVRDSGVAAMPCRQVLSQYAYRVYQLLGLKQEQRFVVCQSEIISPAIAKTSSTERSLLVPFIILSVSLALTVVIAAIRLLCC